MELLLAKRREKLNLFLQLMLSQGLVNNEFVQLQSMKLICGRDFVVWSIIIYWRAARELFTQMSQNLDKVDIEFDEVLSCARDLFERSNSIGAVHVGTACSDIINGCHAHNRDYCINGLTTAKRVFARLQVKFESVLELERSIMECEDMMKAREAENETNPSALPS